MATQTKPRQSRAQRAAKQASQNGAQDQQQPQPPEPGTDETGHGDTLEERSTRPDPADQADPDDDQDDDQGDEPEGGEGDEPEPSQPTATLNPGRYPYFMFRPAVTAPDGTEHVCSHRDGHASIKSMMACARSMGHEAGLTVPAADPSWPDGGPGEPVAE